MPYQQSLTALADPTRRHIFESISTGPQSVSSLAKNMPVSRPAVSQHLKVLSNAGLVIATKRGTQNIYSAKPDGLHELRHYLEQFWGEVLTSFADEVENQKGIPE